VGQLFGALRYKSESRGFDSLWCHWKFSLTSFRSHYGPGVDSASNRNEYQEHFLGVKAAGAKADKSEVRWFDPSWCQWNFSFTLNISDRTMALGSTQPLTEMSTRSISWGERRPAPKADKLCTFVCGLSGILGA